MKVPYKKLRRMILSPGGKGWINKYFDLVDRGEIVLKVERPNGIRKLHFMHLTLANSGIVFGCPLEMIFAQHVDDSGWTSEEKLKLLLFEAHLFVFLQINKEKEFDRDEFVDELISFYQFHNARSVMKIFTFFAKETKEEKLESVLAKRVDIKINYLENKWWVNSLSNAFCYLDVILFDDFIHKEKDADLKRYSTYATNALTAITLSANSDGILEEKEKSIFNVFLASANLGEDERDLLRERFRHGATLDDFSYFVKSHWLFKRFLLDVSILTVLSDEEMTDGEMKFLINLCDFLEIPKHELEENLGVIEAFLLKSRGKVEFMTDSPSYEIVYSNMVKRWSKVLMRNKDKLAAELRESKDLILLVKKSATHELSKEEKEMVKSQFKEIAKSVPALAIFMLPGGAILLPLILKIIPDLVPSAFKENKIGKKG